MDLYKEGCFVLEAKQTAEKVAPKKPGAKVSTEGWENSMQRACTQAMRYAENIATPPPFLIVCDIAHCFDVYAGFDGTARYTPFPIPEKKRLPFADLAQHADLLRTIWTDPFKLDPARHAKRVSEDVAGLLAEVATDLEKSGNKAEYVAEFLMRCLFTMFAEDVGLLEENLFTNALKTRWIPKPDLFPAAIDNLWQAMNAGTIFGMDKLLRFNGGLLHKRERAPAVVRAAQEAAHGGGARLVRVIFRSSARMFRRPQEGLLLRSRPCWPYGAPTALDWAVSGCMNVAPLSS
jgi:hypothetical protein